jgi:hypothetical protein
MVNVPARPPTVDGDRRRRADFGARGSDVALVRSGQRSGSVGGTAATTRACRPAGLGRAGRGALADAGGDRGGRDPGPGSVRGRLASLKSCHQAHSDNRA